METDGHPSQSRYDFDICVALLFPVLLLPVRNRRRQRQKESVPLRFSFGLSNTRQGASRICRSRSVRINLPLGKKRFRLPQEVPSRHRYRHVWFGCRLLVWAGSLARRAGIRFYSAQRTSAHACRRGTITSPSFLLVPSGFSPKHCPVESVFSPHWYLSLPPSAPISLREVALFHRLVR